jgi:hypothetical protein
VGWVSRLAARLSYGNVVATIALFISLGGASYAAIELPADSVGPRQLRTHAVTPKALGFPLGARAVTDPTVQDLRRGPCNSPRRPGEVSHVACPEPLFGGSLSPRRELRVRLRASGWISVSVTVGLEDRGAPSTAVTVTVNIIVDRRIDASRESLLSGGDKLQIPAQSLIPVSRGLHTVGVTVSAEYRSYEPGDVFVFPVSVIASTLPGG